MNPEIPKIHQWSIKTTYRQRILQISLSSPESTYDDTPWHLSGFFWDSNASLYGKLLRLKRRKGVELLYDWQCSRAAWEWIQKSKKIHQQSINTRYRPKKNLTPHFICILLAIPLNHLCLMFHYWNSSDVVVIYILLRKVIAESDFFSHVSLSTGYML